MQRVKCSMSFLAFLLCYVIYTALHGHLLDLAVSHTSSSEDGACVPWVGLERSGTGPVGGLVLARWLPLSRGLGGKEEEGRGRVTLCWGSPQKGGPVAMLLLAPLLKRQGENLGKRQLDEDENDEGMGTGSAGKALDVAKRSPAFANFVLVLARAVVGVPTAVVPSLGLSWAFPTCS